ncbi:WD40 repeat-like protein, partial [Exidia glandulosa HHB12029]
RIATTSFDNTVIVWDVETGDSVTSLLDLGTEVNAVAWSHDGTALAVTVGATVRVHDAVKGDLLNTLDGHAKLVTWAAFSPESTLIATSSKDRTVRVWDCNISKKTVACLAVLTGPNDDVNHVHFSPNGKFLACAADD